MVKKQPEMRWDERAGRWYAAIGTTRPHKGDRRRVYAPPSIAREDVAGAERWLVEEKARRSLPPAERERGRPARRRAPAYKPGAWSFDEVAVDLDEDEPTDDERREIDAAIAAYRKQHMETVRQRDSPRPYQLEVREGRRARFGAW
jgi:hypothetical protein